MQYLAKCKQLKLNCDEKRSTVSRFSANRSFFTNFLYFFVKNMTKIIRFCKKCYFGISSLTLERVPSLSLKTLDTGILLLAVFKLEINYPSETGLCTVAPSPTDTPSPIFFWGEGVAVHRLSETDNPSWNCPSKLTDKVTQIVHSKLKPFPFQIKTYYLSDAIYQTDNASHTNNPSLVWKQPFLLITCWWSLFSHWNKFYDAMFIHQIYFRKLIS